MRLTIAVVVAFILAACTLEQSGAERALVFGGNGRTAQVALDAEAIMQGMAQARSSNERVARASRQPGPNVAPQPLTR